MYNEKRFKITILLTRIRRYLFIFFFVILGLIGAYVISEFLTEIVKLSQQIAYTVMIVTGVSIFLIGFILKSKFEFKIKKVYFLIKILKKLKKVCFKLYKILESSGISISDEISKELKNINKSLPVPKAKKQKSTKIENK